MFVCMRVCILSTFVNKTHPFLWTDPHKIEWLQRSTARLILTSFRLRRNVYFGHRIFWPINLEVWFDECVLSIFQFVFVDVILVLFRVFVNLLSLCSAHLLSSFERKRVKKKPFYPKTFRFPIAPEWIIIKSLYQQRINLFTPQYDRF